MTEVTAKNILTLPDGKYLIEKNLFLIVRRGGLSRSFFFIYKIGGRRREMSLGNAAAKSLRTARADADALRAKLASGIDPLEERKETQKPEKHIPTFREWYDQSLERVLNVRSYKSEDHAKQLRRFMERYALDSLGDMPIDTIKPRDIAQLLEPIWTVKFPTASKTRSYISFFFSAAVSEGIVESNPATWDGNLEMFLPAAKKIHTTKHRAATTFVETKEMIPKLLQQGTKRSYSSRRALLFGIFSVLRQQEFISARWEDISGDIMIVPAVKRKGRCTEDFRLPLSTQLQLLLQYTKKGESGFIFESWRRPDRPIHSHCCIELLNDRFQPDGQYVTVHGFRSVFSSWAGERQFPLEAREFCLMHVLGTTVTRSYMRSDLLEQRRPIMQAWADALISPTDLEELLKLQI